MEPITHFLTGACIGRAGFNRKTACATVVAVLAAEAADLDVLWGFAGPVEELKHHRGITHTFLGAPFVALVTVAVVGGIYAWRHRRRPPPAADIPAARRLPSLRWGWLYLTALVAALSHILLDWSNNYGVRPFFPLQRPLVCRQLHVHRRAGSLGHLPGRAGPALRSSRSPTARSARAAPCSAAATGPSSRSRPPSSSAAGAGRSTPTPGPCSRTSR